MHAHILLNGELLGTADAAVRSISAATLYGHGVFTTLAVHDGAPLLWPQHWTRLKQHAEVIGLDLGGIEMLQVQTALFELVAANEITSGRVRIALLAAGHGIWSAGTEPERPADVLLVSGNSRSLNGPVSLTVSPHQLNSTSPLTGIKSLSYLEHILAWEHARAAGFSEAVRLNQSGEVVSATLANIFWTRGAQLYTPALATGAMAGTTRTCALELAHELGLKVEEVRCGLDELVGADEILLTSSGLGIVNVDTLAERRYGVHHGVGLRDAFKRMVLHV